MISVIVVMDDFRPRKFVDKENMLCGGEAKTKFRK